MICVLLVDERSAVRAGLRMRLALEPDVAVVGEAGDGDIAVAVAEILNPDVVVVSLELSHRDGIAVTASVRQRCPDSAVVVLGLHDHETARERARAAGAAAFVGKHEFDGPLLAAIRLATRGRPTS